MPKEPRFSFKKAQAGAASLLDEAAPPTPDRLPAPLRFAHFWILVVRSFLRNRCPVRASALSYTTLLALIPMLAVVVSVTSSLLKGEGEQRIDQFIQQLVDSVTPPATMSTNTPPPADESPATAAVPAAPTPIPLAPTNVVEGATNAASAAGLAATNTAAFGSLAKDERVIEARKTASRYIHDFIQNTRSGTLGVAGVVLLLWVAISLLSRIEDTFNDIWGVARGRSWFVRVIHYWTTITLGPLLLMVGLGLASGPHFETTKAVISAMPVVGHFLFEILPLLVLWLAFALFYQLMPNTKVKWSAAAVGGLVGSALWFANNAFGFLYVSRVVTNSKIYGSLGLVPVFMIGLYFSWLILLFGAQVAYAYQNRAAYLQEKLAENVNQRGREFVALRLMTTLGQRFQQGAKPATISEMSAELGVPSRLVQQVLHTLLSARLVVEIGGAEMAYAPARPLETINCHHVLVAMRATRGQEIATRDEPVRAEVYGEFARIEEAEKQAAVTVTMLALVNRAQARLELAPAVETKELKPAAPAAPEATPETKPVVPSATVSDRPESAATPATADDVAPEAVVVPDAGTAPTPAPTPEPEQKRAEDPARGAKFFSPEEMPFPD